jgi:hypothetical protein
VQDLHSRQVPIKKAPWLAPWGFWQGLEISRGQPG